MHRPRLFRWFCACGVGALALSGGAAAEPAAATELVPGIRYLQLDSSSTDTSPAAEVIDLRLRPFDPSIDGSTTWATSPDAVRIVLLDRSGSAAWAHHLRNRAPSVLLFAPAGSPAAVDLTLEIDDETVAAAVTAIRDGADPAALARPAVDKRRFDETTLVQRHRGDPAPDAGNAEENATEDDEVAATAPPITDPMLERAVQILQGLRALGRG